MVPPKEAMKSLAIAGLSVVTLTPMPPLPRVMLPANFKKPATKAS